MCKSSAMRCTEAGRAATGRGWLDRTKERIMTHHGERRGHRRAGGALIQTLVGVLLLGWGAPSVAQQVGTGETPDLPVSAPAAAAPDPFTGAMQYRLPLKMVPGRHGMQPDLALVYRSYNPDDPAGHGW